MEKCKFCFRAAVTDEYGLCEKCKGILTNLYIKKGFEVFIFYVTRAALLDELREMDSRKIKKIERQFEKNKMKGGMNGIKRKDTCRLCA